MCRGSLSPCSKYLPKEAIRQTLLAIITILTILWMPGLQASASAQTPFEQACFNAIQGKIPWSREGSTTWHPPNLETLCRGVSHYQARILCFQNGIAGHNDWRRATQECQNVGIATASEQACFNAVQNKIPWSRNGSTAWSPLNVEALCRGVDNHSARITAFRTVSPHTTTGTGRQKNVKASESPPQFNQRRLRCRRSPYQAFPGSHNHRQWVTPSAPRTIWATA